MKNLRKKFAYLNRRSNQVKATPLAILTLSLATFLMTSCDKTADKTIPGSAATSTAIDKSTDNYAFELNQKSDEELVSMLVDFRSRIRDRKVLPMAPAAANWHLEALLNNQLENALAGDDQIIETFTFDAPLQDGYLSGPAIQDLYQQFRNKAQVTLEAINQQSDVAREVVLFDVEPQMVNSNHATFSMSMFMGIPYPIVDALVCDNSQSFAWKTECFNGIGCVDFPTGCSNGYSKKGLNVFMDRWQNLTARGDGCDDNGYYYEGSHGTVTNVTPFQAVSGTAYPHPNPAPGRQYWLPQTPIVNWGPSGSCKSGNLIRGHNDIARARLLALAPQGLFPMNHVFYTNTPNQQWGTLVYNVNVNFGRCISVPPAN